MWIIIAVEDERWCCARTNVDYVPSTDLRAECLDGMCVLTVLGQQLWCTQKLVLLRQWRGWWDLERAKTPFRSLALRSGGRVAGSDVRVVISWGEMRP